ncbi:MAG: Acetophenone carboxylase gamma subunit [Alphaproteobacteria bacterium MarineAlpha9_Bin3]|nr:MAG: Acetophenone carboxylase gamma subunit [Alphaproteobacteria bacterium MarineAlpha9_Bin3]
MSNNKLNNKWNFWIDRGGTFTDIVAKDPLGKFYKKKILSHNPLFYEDSIIAGIKYFLKTKPKSKINSSLINEVRIGTTVATNTLLTRTGDKTCLLITEGFKDSLQIGDQTRPDIFARQILSKKNLYKDVYEIQERLSSTGTILLRLNEFKARNILKKVIKKGYKSLAIVLMHSWKYPKHEKKLGNIAKKMGFKNIYLSHKTAPLIGLNSRGDTTIINAYLTPKLSRYTSEINKKLKNTKIFYMQSSGGLTSSKNFQGKDAVLSGPAGGVIAAVEINKHNKEYSGLIGIDMGGTSTDVFHYEGNYERSLENSISGNKIKVPMLSINTIAAGGGSMISFDGLKINIGPKSAGAIPGPACYGLGGPATITDCNLVLGYIQASNFPKIFGKNGNSYLNINASIKALKLILKKIQKNFNKTMTIEDLALGSINIANENMANAIRHISIEKGHDISNHALIGYGAAAGQHICEVADALNLKTIIIHPFSSVLSAYGMGFAEIKSIKNRTIEKNINTYFNKIPNDFKIIQNIAFKELSADEPSLKIEQVKINKIISLKYENTDSFINVPLKNLSLCLKNFKKLYKNRYGFLHGGKNIIIDHISIEMSIHNKNSNIKTNQIKKNYNVKNNGYCRTFIRNNFKRIKIYKRNKLKFGDCINGPTIIFEDDSSIFIPANWEAYIDQDNQINISKSKKSIQQVKNIKTVDPIRLEIFNNMFMSIAEEMGTVLKNTAYSINIKERLDFSCALFDKKGGLIANAPHIPIHLGAMSESIKSVIKNNKHNMFDGDSFIHNNPYNGGTHLPDITVITPIFISDKKNPSFYVASRAHHSDIGGITPGSMPSMSKHINEEGAVFNGEKIVSQGKLKESKILKIFNQGIYPARDTKSNLADLEAQLAAANSGKNSIIKIVDKYTLSVINFYMKQVKINAEKSIKRVLLKLKNGKYETLMDNGSKINLKITINKKQKSAIFDFTGSSNQVSNNFNAPTAVTKSAILYVLRTLVDKKIPLNDGCLNPIKIIIPKNSILNPTFPAAVVAGNVETSQTIVDTVNCALKVQAACYGTMSNFTFGDKNFGYYETICGGEGASNDHNGTDAIQCHMTNTRLTDPEILELRYPVKVNQFLIRKNSGGKGLFKGGNGVVREIEFNKNLTAVILSNRRKVSPVGILDGDNAKRGINLLKTKNHKIKKLNSSDSINITKGEAIIIKTPGGGGYGKKATL